MDKNTKKYFEEISEKVKVIDFNYEELVNDERFVFPFAEEMIDTIYEQGGRGTRKTYRNMLFAIALALTGISSLIIRNVSGTNIASIYADLIKTLDALGIPYKTLKTPSLEIAIMSSNGVNSKIYFRGMDNTEKLKGTVPLKANPIGLVWFEEALEMLTKKSLKQAWVDIEDILQSFRDPSLSKIRKIFTFNPKWKGHWLYEKTQNLLPNEKLFKTTIYDNPYLPDFHIKSIEKYKDTWEEQWQIMGLGEWADIGERVYNLTPENYYEDNVTLQLFNKINIGVDIGRVDATSFTAIGMDENFQDIYILENYYNKEFENWSKTKMDLINFVEMIRNKYNVNYIELHMEYAGEGNAFMKEVEIEILKRGIGAKVRKAEKILIHDRITYTNYLLSENRFHLKKNTMLDDEMRKSFYDEKGNRANIDDHGINSMEYGIFPEREKLRLGLFYKD